MTTRTVRLHNPGAIRHSSTVFQGQAATQPDDRLVAFQGPEWGLRAMAKLLLMGDGPEDLREAGAMVTRLREMVARENGSDPYPACAYIKAVQLAGLAVRRATDAPLWPPGVPRRPAGFEA